MGAPVRWWVDQIVQRRRHPGVGDVGHLDAGGELEHLAGQMRAAADGGRGVVQRVGVGLGVFAAQAAQRVKAHHHGVLQLVQAFHVDDHNVAQQRQLATHL